MDEQRPAAAGTDRSQAKHRSAQNLALPDGEPHPFSLNAVAAPLLPPADPARQRHAFTVDVEDWYQSCIDYDAPITERVVRNVDRLLAVLDDCGVKGTFFVQGMVAEAFPELVRSLVSLGHEVQSHGYSHRPLYAMDAPALRDELTRAKQTVEDAAGTPVTAFRAQDFSILAGNLSAIEALATTGFEIDSSIFPMRSRHYGIPKWPLVPHYLFGDGFRILRSQSPSAALAPAGYPSPAEAIFGSSRPASSGQGSDRSPLKAAPQSSTATPTSSTLMNLAPTPKSQERSGLRKARAAAISRNECGRC